MLKNHIMGIPLSVYLKNPKTDCETLNGQTKDLAFGVSIMQGWRKNQEDAYTCLPNFVSGKEISIFGVFDGHGGPEVAHYCRDNLPNIIKKFINLEYDIPCALTTAFNEIDVALQTDEVKNQLKDISRYYNQTNNVQSEDLATLDMLKSSIISNPQFIQQLFRNDTFKTIFNKRFNSLIAGTSTNENGSINNEKGNIDDENGNSHNDKSGPSKKEPLVVDLENEIISSSKTSKFCDLSKEKCAPRSPIFVDLENENDDDTECVILTDTLGNASEKKNENNRIYKDGKSSKNSYNADNDEIILLDDKNYNEGQTNAPGNDTFKDSDHDECIKASINSSGYVENSKNIKNVENNKSRKTGKNGNDKEIDGIECENIDENCKNKNDNKEAEDGENIDNVKDGENLNSEETIASYERNLKNNVENDSKNVEMCENKEECQNLEDRKKMNNYENVEVNYKKVDIPSLSKRKVKNVEHTEKIGKTVKECENVEKMEGRSPEDGTKADVKNGEDHFKEANNAEEIDDIVEMHSNVN